MSAPSVKEEARKLVESLDDSATWEDLMYLIYVRHAVTRGLSESAEGRGVPLDEVRRRFGLSA